jgi:hypothetical protein
MIFLVVTLIVVHYLISYGVCVYLNKSYDRKLSKSATSAVVILSGPLTLVSILVIIFVTPLRNAEAGLFDGGGMLVVLLSIFVFPLVSSLLVRFFVAKNWVVKNA